MRIAHILAGAVAILSVQAGAQDPAQTAPTDATQPPGPTGPTSDAAAANGTALATAEARPTLTIRPEDQAAYDSDLATYRTQRRAARIDTAISTREERAYADAMHAWRIQAADCRRGIKAACRAPTPRPSDFW